MQPRVARAAHHGSTDLFDDWLSALDWQDRANCLGVDPDLFFPERGVSTREAKQVCSGCPVRAECLDYALANREHFGVWGGTSERERRRMRGRRHRPMLLAPLASCGDDERIDDPGSVDELELDQADIEIPESDAVAAGNGASRSSRRRDRDRENELRRQRRAAARANPKSAVAVTSAGNEHSPDVRSPDNGSEVAAWQPLAALLAAGAQLEEIRLTMNGGTWLLTRAS